MDNKDKLGFGPLTWLKRKTQTSMIVKRWIVCHRAKGADLKVIGLPVDQSRIILSLFQLSKPGECCAVITHSCSIITKKTLLLFSTAPLAPTFLVLSSCWLWSDVTHMKAFNEPTVRVFGSHVRPKRARGMMGRVRVSPLSSLALPLTSLPTLSERRRGTSQISNQLMPFTRYYSQRFRGTTWENVYPQARTS